MFFVETGTPGLSTGQEENKMGIRTSNTCDVVLEDCRIPAANLIGEEGRGFRYRHADSGPGPRMDGLRGHRYRPARHQRG